MNLIWENKSLLFLVSKNNTKSDTKITLNILQRRKIITFLSEYYKLFENNTDITTAVIQCSSQYLELIGKKLGIGNQKLGIDSTKLRIQEKISQLNYAKSIKNNLDKIIIEFYDSIFGPKNIMELLDCSNNTATSYINILLEIDLIEKVSGLGKSRYKFK